MGIIVISTLMLLLILLIFLFWKYVKILFIILLTLALIYILSIGKAMEDDRIENEYLKTKGEKYVKLQRNI